MSGYGAVPGVLVVGVWVRVGAGISRYRGTAVVSVPMPSEVGLNLVPGHILLSWNDVEIDVPVSLVVGNVDVDLFLELGVVLCDELMDIVGVGLEILVGHAVPVVLVCDRNAPDRCPAGTRLLAVKRVRMGTRCLRMSLGTQLMVNCRSMR
jgi:hypothetical protein